MRIDSTRALKNALRAGPYAWPGGYPVYFITEDGDALSYDAVRENYRFVLTAVRDRYNIGGWRVIGADINWDDNSLYCAHTEKRIESAYGDDEETEHDAI